MTTTFRGKFGRVDVADSASHYFHVRPDGSPTLVACVDGGYPLVYVDTHAGNYLCATCATVELLSGCGFQTWQGVPFSACCWTQPKVTARRSPVFRRWSRPATRDPRDYSRRLVRWGRSVLTLALTPSVHWEGGALTCDNCDRRIRSAYGPLANIRHDRSIGRRAVSERPHRWTRIVRADVSAFYPRARRSVSP